METPQRQEEILAALAENTIKHLGALPQPIVRVCGPLTTGGFGYNENALRLERAEEELAKQGATVFRFGDAEKEIQGKGYEHQAIMDHFHKPILASGLIATTYFLPRWEESKGAGIERELAQEFGIEIKDL